MNQKKNDGNHQPKDRYGRQRTRDDGSEYPHGLK
jgi:hypothetical protein